MRIALFEPDPRVCGPLSWAGHLKTGFTSLGHEVATVSATKSGRTRKSWGAPAWGGHWWSQAPDVVVRYESLARTLDGFDLIVLPEPKCPAEDKAAVKKNELPFYVEALCDTRTKFVTALHGNDYNDKTAPFMRTILELPNFVGKLLVHSRRSWESGDYVKSVPGFELPLPYAPRNEIGAVAAADALRMGEDVPVTAGITGRFMFNKGSHLLALAGIYLPRRYTLEIWGSASTGLGTNVTYATYEALLDYAEKYMRYGDQFEKKDDPRVTEHGNTIRPYHWDVRLKDAALVRYLGNYTDPVATSTRLPVHVNLTGYKYSGGLVEFSTLEAMDAGSLCITPQHVSDDRYRTMKLDGFVNPPGSVKSAVANLDQAKSLALTVMNLADMGAVHTRWRREVVQHNREELRRISDPARIAWRIIEESL